MAKVVKELAPPAHSKYPWEEWLDGRVWELTQGEDFEVSIESFRSTAIGKSRQKGGKLLTRQTAPDVLQIQFYKPQAARKRKVS